MKMKRILTVALGLSLFSLLPSCIGQKENPYTNEALPDLTVTATASAFQQDQAELQLVLSRLVHKDVVIEFDVEGADAGSLSLPESFSVPAGLVKKSIPFSVSSADFAPGSHTVVITPKTEGAKVVSSPISLALEVRDVAFVNLSMTEFDSDAKAYITISLSRTLSQALTLPIKVAGTPSEGAVVLPESAITYESSVTIPAGEREAETVVSLDVSELPAGMYEFVYEIASYPSKAEPGVNAVLRQNVRASIVPTRHPWYTETYWDFYNGRLYTYGGLGVGIERLAAFCLKKSEMPDMEDEDAVREFLETLAEGLDESNTYAAPATESDYIWLSSSIAPDYTVRTYCFVMIGLDAQCRPTGDYDYFEYINESGSDGDDDGGDDGGDDDDTLTLEAKSWSWGYSQGWYYVYKSGMDQTCFSIVTVDQSAGNSSDSAFVIAQIKAGAARVQAGTLKAFNDESFGSATYIWALQPNLAAGSWYAILFGMDADYAPTGAYSLKEVTIE